jgi:hypothetical protein
MAEDQVKKMICKVWDAHADLTVEQLKQKTTQLKRSAIDECIERMRIESAKVVLINNSQTKYTETLINVFVQVPESNLNQEKLEYLVDLVESRLRKICGIHSSLYQTDMNPKYKQFRLTYSVISLI